METRKDSKARKQPMKAKTSKRKENKYKSGRFTRRKSLRSFGNFMGRILKTLGSLAHADNAEQRDADDDDGGFGPSTSGHLKSDFPAKKNSVGSSAHGSVRERLSWCYGDKTPGVLGLKNHGNTCFMNAVVQCLSNTDLLAEYLGLEQYKSDICQGKVSGEERGEEAHAVRGEVTEQLAALVRALWTLEYTPQLSVDFKSIVAKYGSQFRGNSQHDALEFLLWLLDRVHEDANANPDNGNNSSKTKANARGSSSSENPLNPSTHQPRSRHSFVQEHFQAQYRSSLTCPHCLKQSNTFDPFLCISLPIPLRQTRALCVTLVFSAKGQRYVRVGLAVPLFGSISSLRALTAAEGNISPDQVILAELYSTGFQRSFSDEDELTMIADSDVVYAFQAPPLSNRSSLTPRSGYHHSLPSSPHSATTGPAGQKLPQSGRLSSEYLNQSSSSKVILLMCNTLGSGQHAARFGPPFLMLEDRTVSWDQLTQSILSNLYYLMVNASQSQTAGVLFKIRVVGSSAAYSYLSPQDSRPLCHPAVDRALKLCGPGGPVHVKLVIEWERSTKEHLFGSIQEEVVQDAESVRNQQQQHLQQHSCTLDECFQLYTKEEQLAPDDAWKCPHCKQLQQGMVKMSLWTLPDILILHLKRFRQVGERRNKLSTLVGFPLTGLDMAPHVVKRSQSMKNLHQGSSQTNRRPSSGQHQRSDMILPRDYLYDLYAVCNHHGGMHGGHYTAYCRNSVDGLWYSYDDSSVDQVPEEEVCTKGAYILFYQRRNVIPPWSANGSVRGSTSSSLSDHWLIRLTEDGKRGSTVSRSSTACASLMPDSPESTVFHDNAFKDAQGGFESRPFVRGLQGRSVSMRVPNKSKDTLSKVLPLRWSLGSKDRRKHDQVPPQVQDPDPAELVQYLESGRRPRCTKDSIVALMNEPRSTKEAAKGRAADSRRSSSSGTVGCVGKVKEESFYTKVPEGQKPPIDKKNSRTEGSHSKEESRVNISSSSSSNTLTRKKDSRRHSSSKPSKDAQTKEGFDTGVHPSYSSPNLHGTLTRRKGDKAKKDQDGTHEEKAKKGEVPKSHEGLLSFFKGNFLKKDTKKSESDSGRVENKEGSRKTSLTVAMSNGVAGSRTRLEESKSNGYRHQGEGLANGKVGRTPTDIRRSQSSSNITAKPEPNMRRTASLHRNAMSTAPRNLTADKPSYDTLQRNRYSTTSLGRKKTVPESSF
ncbi:ubiquitin carboxyl-terminal hydrolase 43a [Oryzias melastigma]|uniref:ubiquitinyl hydrolase 1 n=1 Tax=Oryzias melastigma TaxID=30732 RepID=A0A3B3CGC4_ORYME|nr:ubiquitin carboxyl-terminal hydrolase 43a [Oryzias melastigma]